MRLGRKRKINRRIGVGLMGGLILTGLTKTKGHEFSLEYLEESGKQLCKAKCTCGFSEDIPHFYNYAGVKELEKIWDLHINSKKRRNSGPNS
jgi:hypothetical protein